MKKFLRSSWGTCVITLLSISLPTKFITAQEGSAPFAEAGITAGSSNFLGDLGGNLGKGTPFLKDNNIELTKWSFGAHFSYYPKDWLGVRVAVNVGKLEGDDNVINGKGGLEEARLARNLSFRSQYQEAIIAAEIFPTVFLEEDASDVYHKFRPYGVIGAGVFHFNPQAQDPQNGEWVNLQPLHTEGQGMAGYPDRKPYKLIQLNIPMGVGLKYWINDNTSLGLEVVHRKTFTDYIDDVSATYVSPTDFNTYFVNNPGLAARAIRLADKSGNNPNYGVGTKRGTPQNSDSYYTVGFKLGFRLGTGDHGYRNSTRCPVIRF
jgi:hypothetical protein